MSREVHFDVHNIEFQNIGVASEKGADAAPTIVKKREKEKENETQNVQNS